MIKLNYILVNIYKKNKIKGDKIKLGDLILMIL